MTDPNRETGLEPFFVALRARSDRPSDDLMMRILADADRFEARTGPRTAALDPWWRQVQDWLGGWDGGLVAVR